MALEKYLEELADASKLLKHADLIRFSGLSPDELKLVESAWAAVEPTRRLQIISRMADLAEDDLTLDFSAILKMALRDPDAEVRERSVAGLWECEDRQLISALVNLLQCDPAERVRTAAAQALGNFAALAEGAKLPPADRDRILQALMETINDSGQSQDVRRRAVEAISPFNDGFVKEIIRAAYESPDADLRRSAIYAMGHNTDPPWLPTILKELENNDPAVRHEAASACGELGEEVAVPHLFRLLKDDDLEVLLAAVRAMGAIGGSAAVKALTSCLRSPDEAVKEAAQVALEMAEYNSDPLTVKFRP